MKLDEVKIRGLLYTKLMTQTELADRSGVTRMTINAICNGKSCSAKTAEKIAGVLEVTVKDIEEIAR